MALRPLTELFQNIENRRVPWRPGPMFVPHGGGAPSLDLSFMSGALDPSVSFARASTATYIDVTGTMQTAGTNVARFDYDPLTHAALGLLIEPASTNLLLWSTSFSNAAWLLFNGATKGAAVTGPDGTLSGMTVNFAAQANSMIYQVVTIAANQTMSFYAQANSLSQARIRFSADGDSATFTLTPQWQRFSFTSTSGSNTNVGIENAGTQGGTVNIAMPQLEAGATPTSYISTTSATITRAADTATIATIPSRNTSAETFGAEFILKQLPTQSPRILGALSGQVGMLFISTGSLACTYDGVAVATASVITLGAVTKAAASWTTPNVGRVSANGGVVGSSTALTAGFAGVTGIHLMGDGVAGDTAYGTIRRVRYWPRALSDAEMQQVTM